MTSALCGTVVEAYIDGGDSNIFHPAKAAIPATPFLSMPIGVLLTNADRDDDWEGNGGWAVVGKDGIMMINRDSTVTGIPVDGDTVFLSKTDEGCFQFGPPNGYAFTLGQIAPIGPKVTSGPCPVLWNYRRPISQSLRLENIVQVNSSTVLVPVMTLPISAGQRYTVDVLLYFSAGVTGGIDVALATSGSASNYIIDYQILQTLPTPYEIVLVNYINVIGARTGLAGPLYGICTIKATLTAVDDSNLSVMFAQHVSDPANTRVAANSYMNLQEGG